METKKSKRYTIATSYKEESRKLSKYKYTSNFLEIAYKYNSNNKNEYLLSDIYLDRLSNLIKYRVLKKLSNPLTLEEIDEFTTQFEDRISLSTELKNNLASANDIFIAYKQNKNVKTLPILYEEDKRYTERNFIRNRLIIYGKNINFITYLLANRKLNVTEDIYENLYELRDCLKFMRPEEIDVYPIIKFYILLTTKNRKFNYYNFRQLALLLKQYETPQKTKEKLEEKEGYYEQLMLDEFLNAIEREDYQTKKLSIK